MRRHLKRAGLLALLAAMIALIFNAPAYADVTVNGPATETMPATVTLEPWVVAILAGTVTPLITGLITKLGASSAVKAITGFVLVAIAAVINTILNSNGMFVVRDVVILFATTFVMHVAMYAGVWKPLGGDGAPTAHIKPDWGIGSVPAKE